MKIIDNQNETLKENLISTIESGSKLSIAASCFSMYAFNELILYGKQSVFNGRDRFC